MNKGLRMTLLLLLIVTFFMRWYSAFGAQDVSGLTAPPWEEFGLLYLLYVSPICAILALLQLIRGKSGTTLYFLSGVPTVLFWLLFLLKGAVFMHWEYSYMGGKLNLLVSILILVTSSISVQNERPKEIR